MSSIVEGLCRGVDRGVKGAPCKAKKLFCRKISDLVGNKSWLSIFIQVLHFERTAFKGYYNDFFSCSESDGQLKNAFREEKTIKSLISMIYDAKL